MALQKANVNVTSSNNLLNIDVYYANAKHKFSACFTVEQLQKCGLPFNTATALEAAKKLIDNAQQQTEGYKMSITPQNNDSEFIIMDVSKADDMFAINVKGLRLDKAEKKKEDLLHDCIIDLKAEVADLKQKNGDLEQMLLSTQNDLLRIAESFNEFKQKMTWKVFNGNQFDPNKEYRVRINKGGNCLNVEIVHGTELFFRCSTANHFYGCVEVNNLHEWHYRHCGNCAVKVKNGNNGYVHSIEERG